MKVIITMPAYRAARTMEKTLREIPRDCFDDVLVVDDASPDDTVAVPSINSSCMRLAHLLQPGCFGRLHVGRFKSRRRLYSGVEV